jgi:hypothetical protein
MLPVLFGGGWILYLQLDPVASQALAADLTATFVDTAHRNPLPYYVWTLPLVMLPSCFFLFWVKRPESTPESKAAMIWFLVTFVLLTLTVSKQRHYALMLIPPACWWLSTWLISIRIPKQGVWGATLVVVIIQVITFFLSSDSRHAGFLNRARPLVASADTLHVVGINSALFDFHLGRHVENTDSVQHAYDRAVPGDAVVMVQQADSWEESAGLPEPILEEDSVEWYRRVYVKEF